MAALLQWYSELKVPRVPLAGHEGGDIIRYQ